MLDSTTYFGKGGSSEHPTYNTSNTTDVVISNLVSQNVL
jgi:hypothetical protein